MCRRERLVTLGTVLLGGVAFVGYLFSTGIVSASGDGDEEEYEEEEEGAGKFGQAGELLGL
ncbi:hypothetical protein KEM55_004229 [Ascosphaera atra]|nr:hypothetical protein KEM55_004229 [Ascosphaera atra]